MKLPKFKMPELSNNALAVLMTLGVIAIVVFLLTMLVKHTVEFVVLFLLAIFVGVIGFIIYMIHKEILRALEKRK